MTNEPQAKEDTVEPLVVHPNRWRCKECCWRGDGSALKFAPNPFDKDAVEIVGCPSCFAVESVELVCDVKDCWEAVSCGWPQDKGYRQTCGKHMHNASMRLEERSAAE